MKKTYKTLFFLLIFSPVFSQNLQDLQKMRLEYEKFKKEIGNPGLITNDNELNQEVENKPNQLMLDIYNQNKEDKEDSFNDFFGYSFFNSPDSLFVWENLPTPSNYLLGPGDELIVSIWGETQLRQNYTISREGKIYDDKVGLLNLAGHSVSTVTEYFKTQFGRVYSTLNGPNPSTYIDVSLGNLGLININFVGHVKFPGLYPIHPFSSLTTGLTQVGGVDTTGSLRNIHIKRDNKIIFTVDLYEYFIKGNSNSSIQLRDQDVVIVPPRNSFVKIDSAVAYPAIYESIEGESIYDMIKYAGGPVYNASDIVGIKVLNKDKSQKDGSIYEYLYVNYNDTKSIPTARDNHVIFSYLHPEKSQVEIIGQVKSPGVYYFYEGLTLDRLLNLSGGFQDTTFSKSVYLDKAEIIRRNPLSQYDQVISFDLKDLEAIKLNKILLQNFDKVVVHANLNFFEKENVHLVGEVMIPGFYPIIKNNESLESFINRAGGLTNKALNEGITIYRNQENYENNFRSKPNKDIYYDDLRYNVESESIDNQKEEDISKSEKIKVAWQNKNISLMPGDSVVFKQKTSSVFISGAVFNPGAQEFKEGRTLRFYINSAGGLTEKANKKGIVVLYPNGMVKPKKWYTSPKIIDGSTVIINEKIEEQPFNMTQFATNWTSIISSMITAIVLSRQL